MILIEITLINLSWFGNYETLYLQVIWAIGLSMISLALVCTLPLKIIAAIGFLIVCGHNALAPISVPHDSFCCPIWTVLHDRGFLLETEFLKIKASYPVLPWIGVIFLGFCSGKFLNQHFLKRSVLRLFYAIGATCFLVLFVLRFFNIYGETHDLGSSGFILKNCDVICELYKISAIT